MPNIAGVDHLRTLGLSNDVIGAYARILSLGVTSVDALVRELDRSESSTREAINSLSHAGLVAVDPGAEVRPVYPGPALERLVAQRAAELAYAQTAVLGNIEAVRRCDLGAELGAVAEVIAGADVEAHLSQAEGGARAEVRSLDSPPYYAERVRGRIEPKNLRRGVRYRVVYAASALDRPGVLDATVAPMIRTGEDARTVASVATKLMIIDDRVAFVALSREPDPATPALLIRPSGLMDGLIGLFEHTWRTATQLDVTGRTGPAQLPAADHRLLVLLAGGGSDDQVARALGVSRRTFFRRIDRLMQRAGATTRFELAARAAKLGWL